MNKKLHTLKYIFIDVLSAIISWSLFFVFRKIYIEPIKFGYDIDIVFDDKFYLALIFIPLFWISLYTLTGTYKNIYRKSRLREFGQTFLTSLIGSFILFFVIILDDEIASYTQYYKSFFTLFLTHFLLTETFRFILTTYTGNRIKNREIGFNTLIIGSNQKALELYHELSNKKHSS